MNLMSKVSIIVPIYNQEREILKCVRSIQEQSYKNIEIILINDGSTDNTKNKIEKLKKTDIRIKTYHQENLGVSTARNKGIKESSGAYIVFVDADDSISPDLIYILLKNAQKTNSDIVSCGSIIKKDKQFHENNFFPREGKVEKKRAIAQLLSNDYYKDSDPWMDIGVPWGKMYNRSFLEKNKICFNPNLRRNEDNIFNLYAFHFANKIYYIKKALYYYDYGNSINASKGYVEDADELYFNYAESTSAFINKFYREDELLTKLCISKKLELLMVMLNSKLYQSDYKVQTKVRLQIVKETCETPPFKILFNTNKELQHINKFYQIIYFLLKNKLYYTAYLLFTLKHKARDIFEVTLSLSKR